MKASKFILGIAVFLFPYLGKAQELKIDKKGVFMGKPYELVEFPNGAWANKTLQTDYRMYKAPLSSNFVKKEVVKIAEGIYTINRMKTSYKKLKN